MDFIPPESSDPGKSVRPPTRVSVRSRPQGYIAATLINVFFSTLFFYLEYDLVAFFFLLIGVLFVPVFAITDRIVFNGKRLYRSGLLYRSLAYIAGTRYWLRPRDVEQVETHINTRMKRGGRVYFRYETIVRGKGQSFSIASGGEDYRKFTNAFLAKLPEELLDANSIEVRDYSGDPAEIRTLVKTSDIPTPDLLATSFKGTGSRWLKVPTPGGPPAKEGLAGKAGTLRRLGNQLKLSGSLLQALESFRRAARFQPQDPWLLFDFARCLRSFAVSERDPKLERKALAMLRLAERHAGRDADLLSRLGESYFQIGEWRRAATVFQKAIDEAGEHFRSVRGMAELALRDGKLAHVVHNFSLASRSARTPSLQKWSKGEAEYFSRLNDDEEYLEMELGRVNLLDALSRWKRILLRFAILGTPIIGFGIYFGDEFAANAGWIISAVALSLWVVLSVARRAFVPRIAPHLLD